ncbi:hypothetical protein FisN_13Hh048 [Fistulifera solaris]|uniref:VWFA domain-containing protein n=1 Tax=Fistulifera solaris TaxID=1519565 RepID=A0A1Z5KNY8_FISSO|nr:hypothetical protein FisN_13Hh048 [Fistulifera solaris]|eukprot:GAX27845.1 hypothetical protein FisN_13Hh048 [Fistulifera solaris]
MESIKQSPHRGPASLYKALSTPRSLLSHPTAASSLLSGSHGRHRRQQRNIKKLDLQRARRYGMKENARFNRIKFTHAGTVFIYDPLKNKEITSYPAAAGKYTGSAFEKPIHLPPYPLPAHAYHQSTNRKAFLHENPRAVTSHSVFLVDMSGSMRCDDVNGARCRADAVWTTIARNYVLDPLKEGTLSSSDVVSIVVFRDTAEVLVAQAPVDYVLFNRILTFREYETVRPEGPGKYLPALDMAESLLEWNKLGSCALSLLFFSDGKPSDRGNFVARTGQIAAKYGHRLTMSCIGMAEPSEDFDTLQAMVEEARDFGVQAVFQRPTMHLSELSVAISSLASSLCTTKTSMIDRRTGRRQMVRTDIVHERKSSVKQDWIRPNHEWKVFSNRDVMNYVLRFSTWDTQRDEFVWLMDSRCVFCYQTVSAGYEGTIETIGKSTVPGDLCHNCQACYICSRCRRPHDPADCATYLQHKTNRKMVVRKVPSFSVAMKHAVFGQGEERIVHQFRFLDDDGNFAGPKWVAKESRFALEGDDLSQQLLRLTYHRDFMRTQVLAQRFATEFNHALDSFQSESRNWPRFRFLEPLVVELVEDGRHLAHKQREIMIEEMLDGEYLKFNNNNGFVMSKGKMTQVPMDPIREVSEDLEDDGDEIVEVTRDGKPVDSIVPSPMCEEIINCEPSTTTTSSEMCIEISKTPVVPYRDSSMEMWIEDFPQAFSHFSHL